MPTKDSKFKSKCAKLIEDREDAIEDAKLLVPMLNTDSIEVFLETLVRLGVSLEIKDNFYPDGISANLGIEEIVSEGIRNGLTDIYNKISDDINPARSEQQILKNF